MAGGDAAEVFEAAERGLDAPAISIALSVMADGVLTGTAARHDRHRSAGLQIAPQGVGIIAAIRDELLQASRSGRDDLHAFRKIGVNI